MSLSREEVQHIASLCRIGIVEEELEQLRQQLSHILQEFEILQQVDTTDIPPTGHSLDLQTVMREDEPTSSFSKGDTLANAPYREGDRFRVRAVLDE